jgi:hypothetical protein
MITAYLNGSRKSIDFGVKALTSWATLMHGAWVRVGRASQDVGQAYVDCGSKLQELTAARARQ